MKHNNYNEICNTCTVLNDLGTAVCTADELVKLVNDLGSRAKKIGPASVVIFENYMTKIVEVCRSKGYF